MKKGGDRDPRTVGCALATLQNNHRSNIALATGWFNQVKGVSVMGEWFALVLRAVDLGHSSDHFTPLQPGSMDILCDPVQDGDQCGTRQVLQ